MGVETYIICTFNYIIDILSILYLLKRKCLLNMQMQGLLMMMMISYMIAHCILIRIEDTAQIGLYIVFCILNYFQLINYKLNFESVPSVGSSIFISSSPFSCSPFTSSCSIDSVGSSGFSSSATACQKILVIK